MDRVKRIWYLSPMRAAKVQASLRIRAVSPEPSLLAHTSSESRGTFRQKARSLAPLNDWACAIKICHHGMLEDTNSLDGAHIEKVVLNSHLGSLIRDISKTVFQWTMLYRSSGVTVNFGILCELSCSRYPKFPMTYRYPKFPMTYRYTKFPMTYRYPKFPMTYRYPKFPMTYRYPKFPMTYNSLFSLGMFTKTILPTILTRLVSKNESLYSLIWTPSRENLSSGGCE